jgi:hypothetical protein
VPVAGGERLQAEGRLDQREAGAVLERALVHVGDEALAQPDANEDIVVARRGG